MRQSVTAVVVFFSCRLYIHSPLTSCRKIQIPQNKQPAGIPDLAGINLANGSRIYVDFSTNWILPWTESAWTIWGDERYISCVLGHKNAVMKVYRVSLNFKWNPAVAFQEGRKNKKNFFQSSSFLDLFYNSPAIYPSIAQTSSRKLPQNIYLYLLIWQ